MNIHKKSRKPVFSANRSESGGKNEISCAEKHSKQSEPKRNDLTEGQFLLHEAFLPFLFC